MKLLMTSDHDDDDDVNGMKTIRDIINKSRIKLKVVMIMYNIIVDRVGYCTK